MQRGGGLVTDFPAEEHHSLGSTGGDVKFEM